MYDVDAYQRAWSRRFGVGSVCASRGLTALASLFKTNEFNSRDAFKFTRFTFRLESNFSANDKSFSSSAFNAFAAWRRVCPELFSDPVRVLDVPPNEALDACLFLIQTYVAQTIFAFLERYYELSAEETRLLFGATTFDWGATIRSELGIDKRVLDELRIEDLAAIGDPFGTIYVKILSPKLRRMLGEFYTPEPLAKYLYSRAISYSQAVGPSFLDPTCGAGVFLTVVLRQLLAEGVEPDDALARIVGYDLSPLAVITSRANLLFAATSRAEPSKRRNVLRELIATRRSQFPDESVVQVYLFNAATNNCEFELSESFDFGSQAVKSAKERSRRFDVALGNPPWLAWDKTSIQYRRATEQCWRDYGLFDLDGRDARYGGCKKELASLIAYATVEKRLNDGGVLGFVLPKGLFQKGKAGDGFRKFGERLSRPFAALELDDFSDVNLFSYVTSKATTFVARKGETTRYPIPLRRWRETSLQSNATAQYPDPTAARLGAALGIELIEGTAEPQSSQPGSALRFRVHVADTFPSANADELTARQSELVSLLLKRGRDNSGERYVAQLGANAAGASGVFWLEDVVSLDEPLVSIRNLNASGKREVERVEALVESALLYPLLRWRDVDEYYARPASTLLLCPQDPVKRRGFSLEKMRGEFPCALAYLERFETILRARAAYKRYHARAPYWSLYNVDVKTFAPYKVAWRRMDAMMRAAAILPDVRRARPIAPQETLSLVPVATLDEADYLCATLNSDVARECFNATYVPGTKSFGSPGALDSIPISKYDPGDSICVELAAIGAERRKRAAEKFANDENKLKPDKKRNRV